MHISASVLSLYSQLHVGVLHELEFRLALAQVELFESIKYLACTYLPLLKCMRTDTLLFVPNFIADPHGIQSSKTSGEPSLVLANSVFFAIKQAVAEARKEAGLTGRFTFDSPATVERIQQACAAKNCTMNCN